MRTVIILLSLSMATLSFAKPDATTTGYLSTYEELAYIESTTIVRSGAGSHTKPCLDPATGDDNRDGTLANPWRTLEALTLHEKQMTPPLTRTPHSNGMEHIQVSAPFNSNNTRCFYRLRLIQP